MHLKEKIEILIAWGTDIPVDVTGNIGSLRKINSSKVKLVIGANDEYISSGKVDDYILALHEQGVEYDFHTFEGTHELHEETIRYFQARLMDDGLEY